MSMINKLKQFKDLRSQAKTMQNALADEETTINESGVTLTMNGNLEMTGLAIDPSMMEQDKKNKLQEAIKKAHGSALKKMQRVMASKMKDMGGLDLPGLK